MFFFFFDEALQPQNVLSMFLFPMKHSYLLNLTGKITPELNNFLLFLKAMQELGDFLHVRRKFSYLIIFSTKLI